MICGALCMVGFGNSALVFWLCPVVGFLGGVVLCYVVWGGVVGGFVCRLLAFC